MSQAVDAPISHLEGSILFPEAFKAIIAWGKVGWFDEVSATSLAQSSSCTIIFSIDLEQNQLAESQF
jgi:hypothetical protein